VFQKLDMLASSGERGKVSLTLVDPIERASLSQCDRVCILLCASIQGYYFI